MVEWLAIWGVAALSVFRLILEDVAKDVAKDAAKSQTPTAHAVDV